MDSLGLQKAQRSCCPGTCAPKVLLVAAVTQLRHPAHFPSMFFASSCFRTARCLMEEFLLANRSQCKILNFCFGKVLNLRQEKQRPLKLSRSVLAQVTALLLPLSSLSNSHCTWQNSYQLEQGQDQIISLLLYRQLLMGCKSFTAQSTPSCSERHRNSAQLLVSPFQQPLSYLLSLLFSLK